MSLFPTYCSRCGQPGHHLQCPPRRDDLSVDWTALIAAHKAEVGVIHERIVAAVTIAERYGTIDGYHHKARVIDQMVRTLLGPDEYAAWRAEYEATGDYEWGDGIAP